MINLAVFASTKGADLQAIIDAKQKGDLAHINLKFVLSDKENCYALERARKAEIKTIFVDPRGKSREEFDRECLEICQKHKIDIIFLIGYMRIITPILIKPFQNKIYNIHPSLLPKYPGMDLDVHAEVLANNEKETGCTLHLVTKDVDKGPIIKQAKVQIKPDDTPNTLKQRVQAEEQKIILEALEDFSK